MEISRELQGSPSTMNKTLVGQKVAAGLCNGEETSCPGLVRAERFPMAQDFQLYCPRAPASRTGWLQA